MKNRNKQRRNRRKKHFEERLNIRSYIGYKDPTPKQAVDLLLSKGYTKILANK